jgi:hypothetical protein
MGCYPTFSHQAPLIAFLVETVNKKSVVFKILCTFYRGRSHNWAAITQSAANWPEVCVSFG